MIPMLRSLLLLALMLVLHPHVYAQKSVLLRAMQDELARSMKELKLNQDAGPYYISYTVTDSCALRITTDSGAIIVNTQNRNRLLKTDVRAGGYDLDSSNFLNISGLGGSTAGVAQAPVEDDYDELRRIFWRATDRAYKTALDALANKKATLANMAPAKKVPDFIPSAPVSSLQAAYALSINQAEWEQKVDAIASIVAAHRDIAKSRVDLNVLVRNIYYANSEGTAAIEPSSSIQLTIAASAKAEDGMTLHNILTYTAAQPDAVPSTTKIESDVQHMLAELSAARTAPVADAYSGPVLFLGQAAGELFNQGIGNRLVLVKPPLTDNAQLNSLIGGLVENPLASKMNLKVMSSFLSMKATPALKQYGNRKLLGAYAMDEEGVLGREVSLIENGILKNLLSSRSPLSETALPSSGHTRWSTTIPGVIQVTSTHRKSYPELKQELLQAAAAEGLPYGYIIRGVTPVTEPKDEDEGGAADLLLARQAMQDPSQFRLTRPYSVFRVYPDGKEEQVRGIEFGVLGIHVLKNILATSDDEIVYDYPISGTSALAGLGGLASSLLANLGAANSGYYATVITPSLLINGVDLKKYTPKYVRPPIVQAPASLAAAP